MRIGVATNAAKAGTGEAVQWNELDPKSYADKTAVVAGFKMAIAEADATLKGNVGDPIRRLAGAVVVGHRAFR